VRAALLEVRRLQARLEETRRAAARRLHELGQQMLVRPLRPPPPPPPAPRWDVVPLAISKHRRRLIRLLLCSVAPAPEAMHQVVAPGRLQPPPPSLPPSAPHTKQGPALRHCSSTHPPILQESRREYEAATLEAHRSTPVAAERGPSREQLAEGQAAASVRALLERSQVCRWLAGRRRQLAAPLPPPVPSSCCPGVSCGERLRWGPGRRPGLRCKPIWPRPACLAGPG
jgi:hypothetical protein